MVRLSRSELNEGLLPALCLRCGQPADARQEHVFTWHPDWVYWLLALSIFPYFLLRPWLTRRWEARVPLCRRHRRHWRWRRAVGWAGAVTSAGLAAVGLWLVLAQASFTGLLVLLGGCYGLIAWLIVTLVLHQTSIRASAIDGDRMTLEGVSPKFAEALQQMRAERGVPLELQSCARCGRESPLLTAFQKWSGRFSCPCCYEQRPL